MNPPRALFAAAAAAMALTACDVPTEPPMFEPRWVIPADGTSLALDELLPAGVTEAGNAFDISVNPVSAFETLGDLCGTACQVLNGLTAPVPDFTGSFQSTQSLPGDVESAEISGGTIDLTITNGFSFDPLENAGSTVTISIADDLTGTVLGELVLDDTDALVPGVTVTETITFQPGSVTGPLRATTSVDVVGGQTAFIDVTDAIDVTATIQSLLVASVTVDVGSRNVSIEARELEFEDVPEDVVDRIQSGAVVLEIDNPFSVTFDGTLDIGTTSKPFSISGDGPSTVTIEYTGAELRSFFDAAGVSLSGAGVANGTSVVIQPGQEILFEATLDFTLLIG